MYSADYGEDTFNVYNQMKEVKYLAVKARANLALVRMKMTGVSKRVALVGVRLTRSELGNHSTQRRKLFLPPHPYH